MSIMSIASPPASELGPENKNVGALEVRPPVLRCLQIQWGWITPGTTASHRERQSTPHLRALEEGVVPATRHFLFVHCGWWLDAGMPVSVRAICSKNPEPGRALAPASRSYIKKLAEFVRADRLEFVAYPYAACVAEATTGEGLLRSFRFSRDLARGIFGKAPRAYMNHDAAYGLDWGTVQMPQIVRLLGGGFVISGRNGTVSAPDGTCVETFGYEKSFYEIAKDPSSLGKPRVYCMELHQQIGHMREFQRGEHFVPKRLGLGVEALTLDEFLSFRNGECRRWRADGIGSKGWYGGVTDAMLIEQEAKSVELRLPALEALLLQAGGRSAAKGARALEALWKRSFVLMDNHLLWQCHRYRPYFVSEAERLSADVRAFEAGRFSGGAEGRTIFNPVPWSRDVLLEEDGRDVLVPDVPGWGARSAVESPQNSAPCFASGTGPVHDFEFGGTRWRLGTCGEIEEICRGDYRLQVDGWGLLQHLRETRPSGGAPDAGNGIGFTHHGCASFDCTVNLANRRCFGGFLDLGGLKGDAFLLRAERLDLNGHVFATEWHKLRNLHWGTFGSASCPGRIPSLPLKLAYAARLRLTVWMVCDGGAAIGEAALRFPDGSLEVLGPGNWRAVIRTSVSYDRPSGVRAQTLRESRLGKTVCFSGSLGPAEFELTARTGTAWPRMEYRLRLHYAEPADLGMTTPPFDAMEGSLMGAQAERPYVPGLAVKFPLPAAARYHADKPYYIQEALDAPGSTWHMDRRDWWMGMSPFIGMNVAMASWEEDSMAVQTRGLKHFFRWRQGGREALALSLGTTLIQVGTQGHTVRAESPFYPLIGRRDHDPYTETPFLRAHGSYEFHFAVEPGFGGAGMKQRLKFWRGAQDFALPVSVHEESPKRPLAGIRSSNEFLIPTAMERRDDGFVIRMVNLSDESQEGELDVSGNGALPVSLPPWAVREFLVP